MKKLKYILLLILLTGILLYTSLNISESFKNSYEFYKKNPMYEEALFLYPILKNLDLDDDYELTIYKNEKGPVNSNKKYFYICGEKKETINRKVLNDPNCIAAFVMDPSIIQPNLYYLPFFLCVGQTLYDSSPFIKNNNTKRDRLAAYIAHHSPVERDKMFRALHSLDTTVDGLGKANHTRDIELPEGWWNLDKVYKDYKFGFAMENADQDGYITEKIMNVYRGGAVPIFWGTYKVKEIFNPDSFVYVNDYDSFEEAAKDIVAIGNDPTRYEAMRNAPIFLENSSPDYSKYYDNSSPQWVINIANKIKSNM